MKKLLFFGYTLEVGGAEKVLVDFLNVLSKDYEIDLVLLRNIGDFKKFLPQNVSIKEIRTNIIKYVLFRYIPFFRKYIINKIAKQKDYYAAIGFIEGRSATFVADIKKPIRKIAWIHNDVEKFDIGIKEKEILDTYNKMDEIVLVSEKAKNNFCNKYKISDKKVTVLYNLVDENSVIEKSKEKIEFPKDNAFTFINVAAMRKQKRQDRLVKIAKNLKEQGYKFRIIIIGSGPEENNIKELISNYNVQDYVILLGRKTNPYPYVKMSDCFVLSSEFEGFGIAVKEALILKKLVLSTKVTGVEEMLENSKYGVLVDNSTPALEQGMKNILEGNINIQEIQSNLQNFDCGNKEIIEKLYTIIEDI